MHPLLGTADVDGPHGTGRALRPPLRPAPPLPGHRRAPGRMGSVHVDPALLAPPGAGRGTGLRSVLLRCAHLRLVLGGARDRPGGPRRPSPPAPRGRRRPRRARAGALGPPRDGSLHGGGRSERRAGLRHHRPSALHGPGRSGPFLVEPAPLGVAVERRAAGAHLAARGLDHPGAGPGRPRRRARTGPRSVDRAAGAEREGVGGGGRAAGRAAHRPVTRSHHRSLPRDHRPARGLRPGRHALARRAPRGPGSQLLRRPVAARGCGVPRRHPRPGDPEQELRAPQGRRVRGRGLRVAQLPRDQRWRHGAAPLAARHGARAPDVRPFVGLRRRPGGAGDRGRPLAAAPPAGGVDLRPPGLRPRFRVPSRPRARAHPRRRSLPGGIRRDGRGGRGPAPLRDQRGLLHAPGDRSRAPDAHRGLGRSGARGPGGSRGARGGAPGRGGGRPDRGGVAPARRTVSPDRRGAARRDGVPRARARIPAPPSLGSIPSASARSVPDARPPPTWRGT